MQRPWGKGKPGVSEELQILGVTEGDRQGVRHKPKRLLGLKRPY